MHQGVALNYPLFNSYPSNCDVSAGKQFMWLHKYSMPRMVSHLELYHNMRLLGIVKNGSPKFQNTVLFFSPRYWYEYICSAGIYNSFFLYKYSQKKPISVALYMVLRNGEYRSRLLKVWQFFLSIRP